MITAIVMGIIAGAFGDKIDAKARSIRDSKGAVLAAYVVLSAIVALIVTAAEWVL